ncbi:meiotic recombination protein REC114 isoform X4 [Mus musculus]|uniref:meiotic recombination protein REC114 isoform X4 n=1 Tax=Mus musculus TaxID=10090 RepID=UPI001671D13A|nr:meiotic recombination protein REC114 isoform X4 [Mus musculus]
MSEAGNVASGLGLPGEVSQWSLKRYGRFMLLDNVGSPGPSSEAAAAGSPTWKEGFSLIGSKNWLKIVRRMDCLLFGTTIKNKSRMFRVQFSGESKEEALERCCGCVQTLAQYVTVQEPDSTTQELQQSQGPREAGESQGKDPLQQGPSLTLEQHVCMAAGAGVLQERTSVTHRAQSGRKDLTAKSHALTSVCTLRFVCSCISTIRREAALASAAPSILAPEKLTLAYEGSSWGTEELGPFLRLCLMDQNFPAFVEEVEKELKKITGLRN